MNNAVMIIVLLLLLPGYAQAWVAFEDKQHQYAATDRVDVASEQPSAGAQVKKFICDRIDCPEHVQVDDLQLDGRHLETAHLAFNYHF